MIIRIQGKTHEDRHEITSAAARAVDEAGGYLLDHRQFSNFAIALDIELPSDGFPKLRHLLTKLKVDLDPPTPEETSLIDRAKDIDHPASLRIAFLADEPDLVIPVPSVPG